MSLHARIKPHEPAGKLVGVRGCSLSPSRVRHFIPHLCFIVHGCLAAQHGHASPRRLVDAWLGRHSQLTKIKVWQKSDSLVERGGFKVAHSPTCDVGSKQGGSFVKNNNNNKVWGQTRVSESANGWLGKSKWWRVMGYGEREDWNWRLWRSRIFCLQWGSERATVV